ncbi:hypothetical protein EDD17DRAFT_1519030, partial [Pisolithus thermaeus]
ISVSTLDLTLWLLPSHADLLTGFMDIDRPSIVPYVPQCHLTVSLWRHFRVSPAFWHLLHWLLQTVLRFKSTW